MSECPECGMRDDDWFLCRRGKCPIGVKSGAAAEIARLQEQVETLTRAHVEAVELAAAAHRDAASFKAGAEKAEAERDRLREMTLRAAEQCDKWVKETYDGGWSTHQVRGQCALAESLRLAALQKEPQP